MTRVLHLSYDGLLEPLGWGQVARYAMRMGREHEIHILSWEKPADLADAARVGQARSELERNGVHWHPLPWHARPPLVSKAYDLAVGTRVARRLVRGHAIQVVHGRSYVASVLALGLKRRMGLRFLFDMRGLWADDRVETGQMRAGSLVHRLAKRYERAFFSEADAIVSLTHAGKAALERWRVAPHVTVIPTCVDTDLFVPRARLWASGIRVGYVGSVGAHYRFDVVARAFAALRSRDHDATLSIVNRGQHDEIGAALDGAGVPRTAWSVRTASPQEVAGAMAGMDVGFFFFDATPAKAFSAPTRAAEFLACGLPFLSNRGIGDLDGLVRNEGVGILADDLDEASISTAIDALPKLLADPGLSARCRTAALSHFSLHAGVERYDALYRSLV